MTPISILIPYRNENATKLWFQVRDSNDDLNGLLEFPGGKVETNETPMQAIIREVNEEVGVELRDKDIKLFKNYNYSYPDKTLSFFIFSYEDNTALFDSDGWRDIGLNDIETLKESIPSANINIIKDFLRSF